MSLYGCIDDATAPNDENSWIPLGFTAEEIGLKNLETEEETCEDEEEVDTLDLEEFIPDEDEQEEEEEDEEDEDVIKELGGSEADRTVCVCQEADCNGGVRLRMGGYVATLMLISVYFRV